MINMLDIGGTIFTIDLDAMSKVLILDEDYESKKITEKVYKKITSSDGLVINNENTIKEFVKPKEYDSSKYDIIRLLFEVLMTHTDEFDDALGFDRAMADSSLPFKITFNTLLSYGILKEIKN